MNHLKLPLLAICSLFPLAQGMAQCGPWPPAQYPLGAGLNGITDYSQDRVFNDVFRTHRSMSANVSSPWNFVAPTTDADGWPTQDFGTVVMAEMDSTMGGTYKLRFNGQATVGQTASGCTIQNVQYDAGTNTTTADIVYPDQISSGELMALTFSNTQYGPGVGGVKNIRIMKPGFDFNAPTFSQVFRDHLERFQCLRFMDWRNTNGNTDSLWTARKLPTDLTQTGSKGIAWEYCIELANILNKDMWINVPHKADSLYIRNLAQLLDASLEPGLHVYVEHSNEVWNYGFVQAGYNRDAALYEAANDPDNPIDYDGITDQYQLAQRRHGLRTKQISDIFRDVMGDAAFNTRFRIMLGSQLGGFYPSMQALGFLNNYFGDPKQYLYGVAVAPYFNSEDADVNNSATIQEVLDALEDKVNVWLFGAADNMIDQYAARCTYFGLKLLCYEGGPDTFGPNNIQAKRSASRTPQMRELCYHFLQKWYGYGNDGLFNWFTAGAGNWTTQYGTWSLTERFENSAKLQAIDSILSTPVEPITAGWAIPGTVEAMKVAGASAATLAASSFTPTGWKGNEEWLLRVPVDSAGTYAFTVETASTAASQKIVLSIDYQYIDTLDIPNNGSITEFVTSALLNTPELTEGLHTLRVKYVVSNPNFKLRNFAFVRTSECIPNSVVTATGRDEQPLPFPDPCTEVLHVPAYTTGMLTITDMTGRTVLRAMPVGQRIDVSGLYPGIYLISGEHGRAQRFVKQ